MARLILVRHGNTFEPGQTPVWVGARSDLALTCEGERQAHAMAEYIAQHLAPVDRIAAGPLRRTRHMAEIIAAQLGRSFSVDPRLCEIDYGLWEGLSSAEITANYGPSALEAWEKQNQWPEDMQWQPGLSDLQTTLGDFLHECHMGSGTFVAVTSNGILRLIHALITGQQREQAMKVKTGHYCVIEAASNGWNIIEWNALPML